MKSRYQMQTCGSRSKPGWGAGERRDPSATEDHRIAKQRVANEIELSFGVEYFALENLARDAESSRRGWLYNVLATTVSSQPMRLICYFFFKTTSDFLLAHSRPLRLLKDQQDLVLNVQVWIFSSWPRMAPNSSLQFCTDLTFMSLQTHPKWSNRRSTY